MEEKTKRKYHSEIDVLRIIAILAVVMIHTTTRTLEFSGYHLQQFQFTLFLNQISRFAVPLFFMISGYVLELSYPFHVSYITYLKKRINRIFIPYIFWSAIYYYFVYTQHSVSFPQSLLTGNASYQLYFIPTLLIFYLIFPLFHRYYHIFVNKFILIFLACIQCTLLFYDYYIHPLPFYYPVSIVLLNFYFFILGFVASHYQQQIKERVAKWQVLLVISVLFLMWYVFFEGKTMYEKTQNYLSFYSQWRPSVMIYTILLSSLLYDIFSRKNIIAPKTVLFISRLTFFVFFIHVIILEDIWRLFVATMDEHAIVIQLWFDPLFFIIVVGISFIIAYIVHKIPLASKITG